ncbi:MULTISPECIES: SDR family oxidoreductase [Roseomonadaceae]|uniref:SDR family NAD(P)-dependent oxidoreductase n=1 Tax=Falsiroseomonas oleicola TaxID=2801474 RepID=A0ABS6H0A3_9PROT|nr:SDR family NAD(P)-dependent oxidoreductase [Roseomonas oleicola]MBU8542100.1 SDR family NAD(P)-dependent oxidoreductase [Roseomonas oleicola]
MARLAGKIAWVTGAGSGIGEAAALALAEEGAELVLTGRREAPLADVAARIAAQGGKAHIQSADMMDSAAVQAIGAFLGEKFGRLDILVNNAGLNIQPRRWAVLSPEGVDELVRGNLNSAFYAVTVALPLMRPQKDGVMIHTASMAGRNISMLSGAGYTAAKHAVVAMSHTINMEECINGIRSCALLPGEVATPILDKRPNPVSLEERAKMVQSADVGDLIRYIACLPKHVTINEVWITPTHNRSYVAALSQKL